MEKNEEALKGLNCFHPLPHDKILDQTKLKAFADDKLNVTKMIISVFDRVENFVGKGDIACTSNFSFSHSVFKRLVSQACQQVTLRGNGLTLSFRMMTQEVSVDSVDQDLISTVHISIVDYN